MNKMKTIGCTLLSAGGLLLGVSATADNVQMVYENDFSTRLSAEPVASTNWVVTYYATNDAVLANNHNVNADSITMFSAVPWQDGWFKMHRGKAYYGNKQNMGAWYVRDDNGNAYASYSTAISGSQTLYAHPIYNSITSGVIRTTFDLRVPKKVHTNGSRLSFTLGTRNMMVESTSKEYLVSTGTGVMDNSLFEAGFKVMNYAEKGGTIVAEAESKRVLGVGWYYGRNPASGAEESNSGPWPAGGEWARVVVEANLDAGTFDVWLSKLGAGHPTYGTESAGGYTYSGRKFYTAYSPSADGPITGIIFHNVHGDTGAYGKTPSYYLEADYDDDYAYKMDNIKMEWKAPDTETFETFYLNDFNTSQRRTLTPAGTTTCDYAATSGAFTDSYEYPESWVMPYGDCSSETVTRQIVPYYSNSTKYNAVGLDGWRRASVQTPAIYITTCGVHRVLAVSGNNCLGWLVQQFGESPTNGKVKLEYDIRIPTRMYKSESPGILQGFVTACLGSKEDWNTTSPANQYFRSGLGCKDATEDGQKLVYPYFVAKSWKNGFDTSDANILTNKYWYRMAITFDLDASPKTGSMTCTEIGADPIGVDDSPADGARTLSSGDWEFLHGYKDLSIIILGLYSGGSYKIDEAMLVTNIKITKNVDTDKAKVIYKNDFKTRTMTFDAASTKRLTAYAHDRQFDGLDTWQRNNNSGLEAYLTADENPALMGARTTAHGYFAQSIGGHYKRGTYVVQADFRVPDYWLDRDGWCDALFGNDMLKTGSQCAEDSNGGYVHTSNYLFGMHIGPASSANAADGIYRRTIFALYCGQSYVYGNDLTANHWYRCVCTVHLAGTGGKANTTDLALYDMGTTHPTKTDAPPADQIAEVSGRPLIASRRDGDDFAHLTTVGIRLRNTASYAFWKGEESGSPIIDNIVIRRIIPGLTVIFR